MYACTRMRSVIFSSVVRVAVLFCGAESLVGIMSRSSASCHLEERNVQYCTIQRERVTKAFREMLPDGATGDTGMRDNRKKGILYFVRRTQSFVYGLTSKATHRI